MPVEYVKLRDENINLKTVLSEKTKEEEKLKDRVKNLEQKCNDITTEFQKYKEKSQEAIKKYLIEYEEIKKDAKKRSLNEKLFKYGTPFIQKNEMRFAEGWEEGDDKLKIEQKIVFYPKIYIFLE